MGKPRDPLYWRKWRARHPEYRARERTRLKARRRAHPEEHRASEAARKARRRAEASIPPLHHGHQILEQARLLALAHVRPNGLVSMYDPLYDDVVGAVVVALLEGTDPHLAAHAAVATERSWRRVTAELF